MQSSQEGKPLLTPEERKELLHFLDNCQLIKGGYSKTRWVKNWNGWETCEPWCFIERDKYVLRGIKGRSTIKVYIKVEGWLFNRWVAVSGYESDRPGYWWEAVRADLPRMRAELRDACILTSDIPLDLL